MSTMGRSVAAAGAPIWRGVGTGRGRHVSQAAEKLVERGVAVVDRGLFVVGEGEAGEHAL